MGLVFLVYLEGERDVARVVDNDVLVNGVGVGRQQGGHRAPQPFKEKNEKEKKIIEQTLKQKQSSRGYRAP